MQSYMWQQEQMLQGQYQTVQEAIRIIQQDAKPIQKQYFSLQIHRM